MADGASTKDEPSTSGADPPTEQQPAPMALNPMEEFAMVKCTNPQEAIAYEKRLKKLVDRTLKWFQRQGHDSWGPINK